MTRTLEEAIAEHNEKMRLIKAQREMNALEMEEKRKLLDEIEEKRRLEAKTLRSTAKDVANMPELRGIIDRLAEIEHDQWMEWSRELVKYESVSEPRRRRWKKLWIPYERLAESEKDKDRKWAYIVLKAIREMEVQNERTGEGLQGIVPPECGIHH